MSDASVYHAGMKLRGAAEDVVDAAQKQADIAVVASSNKMVASVGRAGNAATAHVSKFEDGLDRAQNKMIQKMYILPLDGWNVIRKFFVILMQKKFWTQCQLL